MFKHLKAHHNDSAQSMWLADLTGSALPLWFYQGDAFGSFNSWVRLISGVMFGFAMVNLAFPLLERATRRLLRLDELTRVPVRWKEKGADLNRRPCRVSRA